MLRTFINQLALWAGSKAAVVLSFLSVTLFLTYGFIVGFTENFWLLFNTFMSCLSYIILFVVQYTTSNGEIATQLKLDELIRAMKSADNNLINVECLTEVELLELAEKYKNLAKDCRQNPSA